MACLYGALFVYYSAALIKISSTVVYAIESFTLTVQFSLPTKPDGWDLDYKVRPSEVREALQEGMIILVVISFDKYTRVSFMFCSAH